MHGSSLLPLGKGFAFASIIASLGLGNHLSDLYLALGIIVGILTIVLGRSNQWKSNYEAERVKREALQVENADLRERLAKLEAVPISLANLQKSLSELVGRFDLHDRAERETWAEISAHLEAIAAARTVRPDQ